MEDIWKERNQLVVKKNALIRQVRFDLSTSEQRIVLYLISKIKPTATELEPITISIRKFLELCGLDPNQNLNRQTVKNTLKRLADKSAWLKMPNGDYVLFRWLDQVIFRPRTGTITLRLQASLKPYLLQLRDFYTEYRLAYVLPLRSKFAIRLYELAKSCESMGTATFTVDKLRELLDLAPETFKKYGDFRRYVLELAEREINAHTDIELSFRPIKNGKKVTNIEFQIKAKEDMTQTFQELREVLD